MCFCLQIFILPSLKPLCKLKLTASEGARVRRTALAHFTSKNHSETCLLCLTNLGDTIVLSLPELRRQINAAVIRREDIKYVSYEISVVVIFIYLNHEVYQT